MVVEPIRDYEGARPIDDPIRRLENDAGTLPPWQAAVLASALSAREILALDLPKLIEDGERAQTVAPLLDPTAFIHRGQALAEDLELLRAALPLWQWGKKVRERALKP